MEAAPGKVIRSLRQALDMTQAEFARAAGWSTSTISSWERGTTQPSRLAFKTILAFAEERGVRWQPKAEGGPAASSNLPTLRLGSRLPVAPLVVRDTGRRESLGSRRWTDLADGARETIDLDAEPAADALVAAARAAAFDARVATFESARPDWRLDAQLRLEIGADARWLRQTATLGALAAAIAIGLTVGTVWHRAPRVPHLAEQARVTTPEVDAATAAPEPVDELALVAAAAPALGPAPYAAASALAAPAAPAVRPMPAPMRARLEGIVALDGARRATFRVGDRSVALSEGDEIGGRAVALIADDEVTLVGGGVASRVRLGFETPLD